MDYLTILLIFLLVAVFFELIFRIRLYHSFKERIIIVGLFFILGITWDFYAVSRGHWKFPGNGILGVYVGNLPIEEYLFFLIMPYFAVTFYKTLEKLFHRR